MIDELAKGVSQADSPEKAAQAVAELLEAIASEFCESASFCADNWQDETAGKPWRRLSARANKHADSWRALARRG